MTESTRTASCDAAPVGRRASATERVRRRQERGVDRQRTRVAVDIALDHASRAEVRRHLGGRLALEVLARPATSVSPPGEHRPLVDRARGPHELRRDEVQHSLSQVAERCVG